MRRPQILLSARERTVFTRLVKRGFSQRRKMMLKLLKQEWPADQLEPLFSDLRLPLDVRAEKVSLEQFIGLARLLGQTC